METITEDIETLKEIGDNKKKTVTLTLTQACNLNCTYCYENHKSRNTMSFETAKSILDKELNIDDGFEFVYIDFFGGEPFLEFERIKQIVDYVLSQKVKKKYIFFATTNGTLIHGDVQKWLLEHRDVFQIGLSLDGTKKMHDINRSNSFDRIDLEFYKQNYRHQGIKMTISKETLPYLFEGVKFCHDNKLICNCNLAFGIDWSAEENKTILNGELSKLIDYYLQHPDIEPCSLLSQGIEQIGYDNLQDVNRKWCGVGTHMRTYDVDGSVYPCQFFMPLSAGEEKAAKAKDLVFTQDIDINCLDECCKSCVIRAACPTCYGSNYVSTGNIYRKDPNLCILTKIIIKARSFFKAQQWEAKQLKISKDEEQALLRSIIKIQENLVI